MDILNSFKISGSAMQAQSQRLDTISSNLANIETTSTPEGGPYKKKSVYFQSTPLSFQNQLDNSLRQSTQGSQGHKNHRRSTPAAERSMTRPTPTPMVMAMWPCPTSTIWRRWWI
jgi:flagellar basal body rod protein FlgC